MNGSKHKFMLLAKEVFPGYMNQLHEAISQAENAVDVLNRKEKEFKGCYVFIEGRKPIYVGISKHVRRRLKQHLNANSHNDSSFVYNIAKAMKEEIKTFRKTFKDQRYQEPFQQARERVRQCAVAWVKIDDSLELYLFEAYACMELGTSDYNSFETH
jgi:predicted GIY-YIG superfamily endonuclease